MPLPLYTPPTIDPGASLNLSQLIQSVQPVHKKQILGHFTHKKMEDRISQRTWYENVTYRDELKVAMIMRSNIISSANPKMK